MPANQNKLIKSYYKWNASIQQPVPMIKSIFIWWLEMDKHICEVTEFQS